MFLNAMKLRCKKHNTTCPQQVVLWGTGMFVYIHKAGIVLWTLDSCLCIVLGTAPGAPDPIPNTTCWGHTMAKGLPGSIRLATGETRCSGRWTGSLDILRLLELQRELLYEQFSDLPTLGIHHLSMPPNPSFLCVAESSQGAGFLDCLMAVSLGPPTESTLPRRFGKG